MGDSLRYRRLADFHRRADFAPDSVYRHKDRGWPYIPIHPFADESADLSRLRVSPPECSSIDAWCKLNGDVTLLQMSVVGGGWSQGAGLYARQTDGDLRWVYLAAITDRESVTRILFERAMSRFVALGYPDDERFVLNSSDGMVRIGDPTVA